MNQNENNLPPEAPGILKNIKWFVQYGRKNIKIIILGAVVLGAVPAFKYLLPLINKEESIPLKVNTETIVRNHLLLETKTLTVQSGSSELDRTAVEDVWFQIASISPNLYAFRTKNINYSNDTLCYVNNLNDTIITLTGNSGPGNFLLELKNFNPTNRSVEVFFYKKQ